MSAKTVQLFENKTLPSETHLSLGDGGPPYTVHGVALGEGDVTLGSSGTKKKWPADELREAAKSLQGTDLVIDHDNTARGVIGEVTKAGYKDGIGVIYQAELYDEEIAEKIEQGLLEVSVRGRHDHIDNLNEDEETGALIARNIVFENLSVVSSGASPSNTLEMGEHDELSAAELRAFTESISELAEVEPGMFVQWDGGDKHGVVLSTEQDGEFEIDVYEEIDGKWRAVGKTTMIDADSLDEWSPEEDNIGPMKEPKSEEENSSASLEGAQFSAGDWVEWPTQGSPNVGRIEGVYHEGDELPDFRGDPDLSPNEGEHLYAIQLYEQDDDGVWHPVEDGLIGHYEPTLTKIDEPDNVSDETIELSAMLAENSLTTADAIVREVFGEHDPMGSDEREDAERLTELALDATLDSSADELDEVYSKWREHVNMSASELRRWSKNPCSREASIDPKAVIRRNLRLLERNKDEWTSNDIADAKRTISFISRMRAVDEPDKDGGPHGCPSKRDISLLNWAYNPFDSLPTRPNDEDLDSVEAVELSDSTMNETTERNVAELQEYAMHEPSWDSLADEDRDWNRPSLEDFVGEMDLDVSQWDEMTEEQQTMIADHFIIAEGEFPPENYGDLKLPVVHPDGSLSLSALRTVKGGRGVSAVEGLGSEMEEAIIEMVNDLANEHFDRNWGMSDEENSALTGVTVLSGDDLRHDTGAEVRNKDSLNQITTMNDELEEELSQLDEPTAVEQEEIEELREKADRFDEMDDKLASLEERTELLDEVDRSQVEELSEVDDPVVLESEEYEELQQEAEEVKEVYAASLAEEVDIFSADELTDKYGIAELREKFEETVGSVNELSQPSPDPKSQDHSEEDLSADESEEELAGQIEQEQERLREEVLDI